MRFVQFRLLNDIANNTRIGLEMKNSTFIDLSDLLPSCFSLVDALAKTGMEGLMEKAKSKLVWGVFKYCFKNEITKRHSIF